MRIKFTHILDRFNLCQDVDTDDQTVQFLFFNWREARIF